MIGTPVFCQFAGTSEYCESSNTHSCCFLSKGADEHKRSSITCPRPFYQVESEFEPRHLGTCWGTYAETFLHLPKPASSPFRCLSVDSFTPTRDGLSHSSVDLGCGSSRGGPAVSALPPPASCRAATAGNPGSGGTERPLPSTLPGARFKSTEWMVWSVK